MKMKVHLSAIACLACAQAFIAPLHADLIAQYTFGTSNPGSLASTDIHATTTAANLVIGSGINFNNPGSLGGASGIIFSGGEGGSGNMYWVQGTDVTATDLAAAKTNNEYMQITVNVPGPDQLTGLDSLTFYTASPDTGNTRTFGFAAAVAVNGSGTFSDSADVITFSNPSTTWVQHNIDLTGIALGPMVTSVDVRLFQWNNSAGTGANRGIVIDSMELNGSITVIPEPSSIALVLLALSGIGFAKRRK